MLWLIYALFSAIFMSLTEIFQKKALFKEHSLEFGLERSFFALLLLFAIIPFIEWNIPPLTFLIIFFFSLIFVVADLYRSKSYKHMEISVASPFYNLSPAIVAFFSFFFLGEILTQKQIIGIIIVVIGAYILEVDHNIHTLFSPVKKLLKSKCTYIILFALIVLGISALFEKHIIDFYLEPTQFLFLFLLFLTLNYFVITLIKGGIKEVKNSFKKAKKDSFFSAMFWNLEILFYFMALQLQMVSIVMPIKRLHTLFTTIGGGTIFKDKGLYMKAVACIIMLFGIFLIVI